MARKKPRASTKRWNGNIIALIVVGITCMYFGLTLKHDTFLTVDFPLETNASMDDLIQDFHTWFEEKGGIATGIRLKAFERMGNGIQVMDNVDEGEQVLFVPIDVIICRKTVRKALGKEKRKLVSKIGQEDVLLSVFLMHELSQQNESQWAPYLKLLPKAIDRPIFYGEATLDELQDASLKDEVRRAKKILDQQYEKVKPTLISLVSSQKYRSKALFLWAMSMISSRALSIQGDRYLVPFADMFNGMPHEIVRKADNGQHFLKYHQLSDKGMAILADRKCTKNQQLFEDYGDTDNTLFLQYHGFVMESNNFDCAKLPLPSISSSEGATSKKKILKMLNILDAPVVCFYRHGAPQIDRQKYYIKLLVMNEEEATACENSLPATKAGLHEWDESKCFDMPSAMLRFASIMSALASNELQNYPTTLEDDTRRLLFHAEMLTPYERTALRYRIERKKLLRALEHSHETPVSETGASLAEKAAAFNAWVEKHSFQPNKLIVKLATSDGMRLGTYAKSTIENDEIYLGVPSNVLMNIDSANQCPVMGPVIQDLKKRLGGSDMLHEILFHLMYEKFERRTSSFWAPYLDLIPGVNELESPLFYSKHQMELLKGTDMYEAVLNYKEKVEHKYNVIASKVFEFYPEVFKTQIFTLENYRWAYGILDSRSIWWSGQRHLVPLLDMINCAEGPDPSRVHSTSYDEETQTAVTAAKWQFEKGQEVFENYGQPNHIYFLYHGFILEKNSRDCAHLRFSIESRSDLKELSKIGVRTLTPEFCLRPAVIPSQLLQLLHWLHTNTLEASNDTRLKKGREFLIQELQLRIDRLETKDSFTDNFRENMIQKYRIEQLKLLKQVRMYLTSKDEL